MKARLILSILAVLLFLAVPVSTGRQAPLQASDSFTPDAACETALGSLASAEAGFRAQVLPQIADHISEANAEEIFAHFHERVAADCGSFQLASCVDESYTDPAFIMRLCTFGCSWLRQGRYSVTAGAAIHPVSVLEDPVSPTVYGAVQCGGYPAPVLGISCAAVGNLDQVSTSCDNAFNEGIALTPVGGAVFFACCGSGADTFFTTTSWEVP